MFHDGASERAIPPVSNFYNAQRAIVTMPNFAVLDNVKHQDLKVDTRHAAEYGDSVNQVLAFPSEFIELQKEYPILLRKDPETDQYQAVVILGLEKDENLFLDSEGWQAHYVPAIQARGPFSIGLRRQQEGGEEQVEPVIHVDMDSPRIRPEGTPVFLPQGGSSDYLQRITTVLKVIQEGWAAGKTLYPTLDEMGLIEPLNVNINLSDTQRYSIKNYFTINEDRLAELDGEQLKKLNDLGYLQAAYHILASQTNISRLAARKNRQGAVA